MPLAGRPLTRPLYLVRRQGRTLPLAAQSLWELLAAHRGDIGGAGGREG